MINNGGGPSSGRVSSGEFNSMATTVSSVVIPAITDSGRPKRTLMLIVDTSRVTRVTRSPVLALSTLPNGSPRTVCTTYSRASDSKSWPKITDTHSAKKVKIACIATTPVTASARPSSVDAKVPPADAASTSEPRMRGTIRPATPASACSSSSAVIIKRRLLSKRAVKALTSRRSATGSPRSGLRESAKNSSARRSRSRWRRRSARSRDANEPLSGGNNTSGTCGVGGVDRQVSAEPSKPICSSAIGFLRGLVQRARHRTPVVRVCPQQFLMRPVRRDPLVEQERHAIGMVQQERRYCGHDCGLAATMCHQPLGDQRLSMRIDRRGGFDQDQDLGVEPQHPRQHHSLPLPSGQAASPFIDPTLPTAVRAGENILGRGDTQYSLGRVEAEPPVRIDGRLQRAGENLACTVADHNALPHLINWHVGEVHCAQAHAPLLPPERAVSLRQPARSIRCCFRARLAARPLRPSTTSRLTGS